MDLAKKLGQALASSDVLFEYREAEQQMASDTVARSLTRTFKSKHSELNIKQKDDNCDSLDLQILLEELQEADKVMKEHPLIATYYEKGQRLNELIYQINEILRFYTVNQDEAGQFSNSGCQDCSNCSN